jgi:serine/threonine protein kinase/Tfp pilus assembly protein PilF
VLTTESERPALEEFIDEVVEAFESSGCSGQREIEQFLPNRDHPFYLPALRELVRVDLELSSCRGRPKRLEHYQLRFPELFEDPLCLEEIAFEEYRLRKLAGESPAADEYRNRFGLVTDAWPDVQCGERLRDEPVGGDAGILGALGFRLVAELGRGAFGRAYLAKQPALADRLVVLKISNDLSAESQSLAQLQHTNIVPVYSVHRSSGYQAVCMPYFGPTTLADVLRELRCRSFLPSSGREFLSTLDNRKHAMVTSPSNDQPAEQGTTAGEFTESDELACGILPSLGKSETLLAMIQGLSFVETVVWIIARLADGLAHAHEHGILHHDLKPANVLLTDEGQPMLLDFSLSSDTKRHSNAPAEFVGGTLPYMAPEHLDGLRDGSPPADARSDLFSLGVIFYELLTLRHPFNLRHGPLQVVVPEMIADRRRGAPELRCWNRAASPAVESIVRRCLEPDPAHRYQTARQLQEDLDRHLQNLPLKHAANRSVSERVRKWIRRHPRLASSTSVVTAAMFVILMLSVSSLVRREQVARLQAIHTWMEYRTRANEVHNLLNVPGADRGQIEQGIALCRRVLDDYQILTNSRWLETDRVRKLPAAEQARLRQEIGELLFLLADATAKRTDLHSGLSQRRSSILSAVHLNALSESCYAAEQLPRALWLQRAELQRAAGDQSAANAAERRACETPLRSARDFYLLGGQHFSHREYRQAIEVLKQANDLAPQDFTIWMLLGNSYAGAGQLENAVGCYSAGTALSPDSHWPYFNRGLAHYDLGQFEQASADFSKALELRPEHIESRINRGLSRLALGDHSRAIDDFTSVLEHDVAHVRVYLMRARARELGGDSTGAALDRAEGMRREPTDELSWIARGVAQLQADPAAGFDDFDRALELNPHSRDALQNKAHVLSERLGRTDDAIAVLDVAVAEFPDFTLARAGRGVLLARSGNRDAAHRDAQEVLARDTKPETLYQIAGVYALTSPQNPADRAEALRLLASALRQDPSWLDVVPTDRDLDDIRNDQEFRRLIETINELSRVAPAATRH